METVLPYWNIDKCTFKSTMTLTYSGRVVSASATCRLTDSDCAKERCPILVGLKELGYDVKGNICGE